MMAVVASGSSHLVEENGDLLHGLWPMDRFSFAVGLCTHELKDYP
jgi:hypothetical protein